MPILPLASRLLISALHLSPPSTGPSTAELADRGAGNLGDELANDVELCILTRLDQPVPESEPLAATNSTTTITETIAAAPQARPSAHLQRHRRADSVSTVSSTTSSVQGMTSDEHRRRAAHQAWIEYW